MEMNLSLYETRVIGCLMEKERTTPDQYPLSLNALTNACNQKSSREPVLDLDETIVQETLDELKKKRLVSEQSGFGSRVVKIKHRFCNSEFGELQLTPEEYAIICVLFLRGPQTPGELRTRTNRLCEFSDVREVEATLLGLVNRECDPLVTKLPREPGKRDARYAHLFSGDIEVPQTFDHAPELTTTVNNDERIRVLEERVDALSSELEQLKEQLAPIL